MSEKFRFPEGDFKTIGEAYLARKRSGDLGGPQVVEIDHETDSFDIGTDSTEDSGPIRLDAGETLDEDEDLTEAEAYEKAKSGEPVAMWEVTDE